MAFLITDKLIVINYFNGQVLLAIAAFVCYGSAFVPVRFQKEGHMDFDLLGWLKMLSRHNIQFVNSWSLPCLSADCSGGVVGVPAGVRWNVQKEGSMLVKTRTRCCNRFPACSCGRNATQTPAAPAVDVAAVTLAPAQCCNLFPACTCARNVTVTPAAEIETVSTPAAEIHASISTPAAEIEEQSPVSEAATEDPVVTTPVTGTTPPETLNRAY